jgi:hypothetical protein
MYYQHKATLTNCVSKNSWKGLSILNFTLIFGLLLAGGLAARATDRTWTGAVSWEWNNATNWNPQGIPNSGDTVYISSGYVNFSSVYFSGQMHWSGGQFYSGRLVLAPETVLTISGPALKNIANVALENQGRIIWTNTGGLEWSSASGTIVNNSNAVWEIANDTSLLEAYVSLVGSITNYGTVVKTSGTGTNTLVARFHNHGKVETQTGTMRFHGRTTESASTGEFAAAAGARNQFASGTFQWNGARFTGAGANQVTDYVTFNGSLSSTNLELTAGGRLNGTNTLEGQVFWTGGELTAGHVTMASNAVLMISGTEQKRLNNTRLENQGRIIWTNAGGLVWSSVSGTIVNNAGAVWEIANDA